MVKQPTSDNFVEESNNRIFPVIKIVKSMQDKRVTVRQSEIRLISRNAVNNTRPDAFGIGTAECKENISQGHNPQPAILVRLE